MDHEKIYLNPVFGHSAHVLLPWDRHGADFSLELILTQRYLRLDPGFNADRQQQQ